MYFTKEDIKNKKITIIGLKKSGYSAAILAYNFGAEVFVSDCKDDNDTRDNYNKLIKKGIQCEIGKHSERIFNSNFWVISPGVPKDIDIIRKAGKLNISILGEIEFASKFTDKPIVAVTGSNGKSTTVNILFEMLKVGGYKPLLAGNIGKPFSKGIYELLNDLIEVDIIILEISSFQMEYIKHFSPHILIYTNISPDHLDRHGSMEEYIKMKLEASKNIKDDSCVIYNIDDIQLERALSQISKIKEPFSIKSQNVLFNINGNNLFGPSDEKLLSLDDINIPGKHNLFNFLAAATCSHLLGVPQDHIVRSIKTFKGVEHRLEHVALINDVEFINDSKATNIDAVIVAINTFKKPIVLILGGYNKGANFRLLLPHIKSSHVRDIVSYGDAGGQINTDLGDAVRSVLVTDLNSAVKRAQSMAAPGDIILLSPGCASFDEFSNFEERGNYFKSIVGTYK